MAESNGIRFFLFVSFFTFGFLPALGLKVQLNTAENTILWKGEIIHTIRHGFSVYGIGNPVCKVPKLQRGTIKVIYYIVDSTRFKQIMHPLAETQRLELKNDLAKKKHELFYLQVENFEAEDEKKIHDFLSDAVYGYHNFRTFEINVIVDKRIETTFAPRRQSEDTFLEDYKEVDAADLMKRLTSIKPKGPLRELMLQDEDTDI